MIPQSNEIQSWRFDWYYWEEEDLFLLRLLGCEAKFLEQPGTVMESLPWKEASREKVRAKSQSQCLELALNLYLCEPISMFPAPALFFYCCIYLNWVLIVYHEKDTG